MKTILETLSDSLESSQNGRSLIENVNTALKERLSLRFTCIINSAICDAGMTNEDIDLDIQDLSESLCSAVCDDWQMLPVSDVTDLGFCPF